MITETFLVIKGPITLRVEPKPIKNHPAYTPFYYVTPFAFILILKISDSR
jgi:hypothetical protein